MLGTWLVSPPFAGAGGISQLHVLRDHVALGLLWLCFPVVVPDSLQPALAPGCVRCPLFSLAAVWYWCDEGDRDRCSHLSWHLMSGPLATAAGLGG